MKIANYVSSLLPRIARSDVSKNLEDLRVELRDQTVAPYKSAADVFNDWSWKTDFAKNFEKTLDKEVKSRFRGNYVDVVGQILNRTLETITTLEKLVDRMYAKDIIATALSYSETQLLQLIEVVSFVSKYSRKLLIRTIAMEIDTQRKKPTVTTRLTPAEVRWLDNNAMLFMHALRALDRSPADLEKVFKSIPDIEVDVENANNVIASVGAKKLDPLGLSSQGVILNPIYHIRVAYTDWQVARYEAAKEERKLLEYQILDMKNAKAGNEDAKLEKALEYTEDRLSRLNYKIEKIEEEAA